MTGGRVSVIIQGFVNKLGNLPNLSQTMSTLSRPCLNQKDVWGEPAGVNGCNMTLPVAVSSDSVLQ